MQRKIPTSKLNEVMLKHIENYSPPATDGKLITIKYVTQLPTKNSIICVFYQPPEIYPRQL
jgi:GTP-binding protein